MKTALSEKGELLIACCYENWLVKHINGIFVVKHGERSVSSSCHSIGLAIFFLYKITLFYRGNSFSKIIINSCELRTAIHFSRVDYFHVDARWSCIKLNVIKCNDKIFVMIQFSLLFWKRMKNSIEE